MIAGLCVRPVRLPQSSANQARAAIFWASSAMCLTTAVKTGRPKIDRERNKPARLSAGLHALQAGQFVVDNGRGITVCGDRLEVEPVARFNVDLTWISAVCSAEGIAVVQHIPTIGNVEGVHGKRPGFAERFPE